jgi:hypothetical protein
LAKFLFKALQRLMLKLYLSLSLFTHFLAESPDRPAQPVDPEAILADTHLHMYILII